MLNAQSIAITKVPLQSRPQSRRLIPQRLQVRNAIPIPNEYGCVLGSVAVNALMTYYLAVKVALARKTYNVKYPSMYAEGDSDDAKTFNCIQRSHQNTLEYLPNVLALQIVLGFFHPLAAAALGFSWACGRIVYAQGYSTGDPSSRSPGSAISGIIYLALIFTSLYTGVKLVL